MTSSELRSLMTKHGWTQVYIADAIPVKSTRIIRYWLTDHTPIREVNAHRIRALAAEAGRKV
jgi:transcriptional regulator with XRE-family HTH domain